MFSFWKKEKNVKDTAKTQLEKHRDVFESLQAYDKGEKENHTANVKRHLRNLHHTINSNQLHK